MVYAVVSAPLDPPIAKERPICLALVPAIDRHARSGVVRYGSCHKTSLSLIRFHLSFNCIVVLTALFLSSCYWQPVTLDTPLYKPWNNNITTFGHALKAMLPQNSTLDVQVVQFEDRCWCDVTNKYFFQPFNVTQWEVDSLKLYAEDAARQQQKESEKEVKSITNTTLSAPTNGTQPSQPVLLMSDLANLYGIILSRWKSTFTPLNATRPSVTPSTTLSPSQSTPPPSESTIAYIPTRDQKSLPWWQREYSLCPYGYDIVFEFGWNDERY